MFYFSDFLFSALGKGSFSHFSKNKTRTITKLALKKEEQQKRPTFVYVVFYIRFSCDCTVAVERCLKLM